MDKYKTTEERMPPKVRFSQIGISKFLLFGPAYC